MSNPDHGQPAELVIDLDPAITLGEVSFERLVLREPTAGEMRQIRKRALVDQQVAAVALVAGVPEQAVDRMPISVVERAETYLVGFMTAARKTGGE